MNTNVYEKFQSYRKGWRDGATSKAQDEKFLLHGTPHIRTQYSRGYREGHEAYRLAMKAEMDRTGYVPSILREAADVEP